MHVFVYSLTEPMYFLVKWQECGDCFSTTPCSSAIEFHFHFPLVKWSQLPIINKILNRFKISIKAERPLLRTINRC